MQDLKIQKQILKIAFKTITKILPPVQQPDMLKILRPVKKCLMDKPDVVVAISGLIKNPKRDAVSNSTKLWVLLTQIGYLAQKIAKDIICHSV